MTRKVAAFDFDGTVSRRDTLVPFLVKAAGSAKFASVAAQLGLHGARGDGGHQLAALPGGKAWIVMDGLAFDRMPYFDFERGGKVPPVAMRAGAVTACL